MTDGQTTVQQMKDLVQHFISERDWEQFHDPKNLSMSIAIEAGELMEHFQWFKSDQLAELNDNDEVMRQIREELADVYCYVLSFASTMDIDLCSALEDKMAKNRRKYPVQQYRGRF